MWGSELFGGLSSGFCLTNQKNANAHDLWVRIHNLVNEMWVIWEKVSCGRLLLWNPGEPSYLSRLTEVSAEPPPPFMSVTQETGSIQVCAA